MNNGIIEKIIAETINTPSLMRTAILAVVLDLANPISIRHITDTKIQMIAFFKGISPNIKRSKDKGMVIKVDFVCS